MNDLIAEIVHALGRGETVGLSTVVRRRGSLPMSRRARMLVRADASTRGTVGGGCLEAEVFAIARGLMATGGSSIDTFNLTEVEDGLDGHVCGGTVTLLTEALMPTPASRRLFEALDGALREDRAAILGTLLPPAPLPAVDLPRHVLVQDGEPMLADSDAARVEGLVNALQDLLGATEPASLSLPLASGEVTYFVEPMRRAPGALIFGAGHCGRAIGQIAALAGFRVLVMDDRPTFLDETTMPWADEVRLVDFERALAGDAVGGHDYLVIVTRGHEHDLTVLRQVLDTPAAYLGMIGSVRKRHLFLETLRAEGVDEARLGRLRSPMGLAIAADTPEEIAVAVVAEMVAVRRGARVAAELASGRSSRRPATVARR